MNSNTQAYFIYMGKIYPKYTKLTLKYNGDIITAHFIDVRYYKNKKYYAFLYCEQRKDISMPWNTNETYISYNEADFIDSLISVEEATMEAAGFEEIKPKDRDIDKLFHGWLWYIALMLFSSILQYNFVYWIIISITFFTWRYFVKKEETYIVRK